MGYLSFTGFNLMILAVIILFSICFFIIKVSMKKKLSVFIYALLLSIMPLLSLFLTIIIINTSSLDFFGYIFVILFSSSIFLGVWIFTAFNGEYEKVELSMYIVAGGAIIIFMILIGLIEILPGDILKLYLEPLLSKGSQYDVFSRTPYQLAHFITYTIFFPYLASFVFGRIALKVRKYKRLAEI